MSAHKGKTDRAEDLEVIESLKKDGYSEGVIDRWLNPRNLGQMENYDGYSGKITSFCGDSMWVWLKVKGDVIQKVTYLSDICIGGYFFREYVDGNGREQNDKRGFDDFVR